MIEYASVSNYVPLDSFNETPVGRSMTVPGMASSIDELLLKAARGLLSDVTSYGQYDYDSDEEVQDFDFPSEYVDKVDALAQLNDIKDKVRSAISGRSRHSSPDSSSSDSTDHDTPPSESVLE